MSNTSASALNPADLRATTRSSAKSSARRTISNKRSLADSNAGGAPVYREDRDPPLLATVGPGKSHPDTASAFVSSNMRNSEMPSAKARMPVSRGSVEVVVLPSPAPSDTQSNTDRRELEDVTTPAATAARNTPLSSPVTATANEWRQTASSAEGNTGAEGAREPSTETRESAGRSEGQQANQTTLPQPVSDNNLTNNKRPLGPLGAGEVAKRLKLSTPLQPLSESTRPVSDSAQVSAPNQPTSQRQSPDSTRNSIGIEGQNFSPPPYTQGNLPTPPIPQVLTPMVPSLNSPIMAQPTQRNIFSPTYPFSLPPTAPSPSFPTPNSPAQQSYFTVQDQVIPNSPLQTPTSEQASLPRPAKRQRSLPQQANQPQSRQQTLPKLKSLITKYDDYIRKEGGPDCRKFSAAECFRFRMLRDAITKEDWFFAVLHQLYAYSATNQRHFQDLIRADVNSPPFELMGELFDKNSVLSTKCLAYFSAFPVPLSEALEQLHFYPILMNQVASFFANGYKVR
jgi:hypothetical protein